jgi:phosphatidylethanolamine/phosphatidyl-N-methylethanolamine N-methyltransferase
LMQIDAVRKSYARWAPVYDLTFGKITNGGRIKAAAHVNQMGGSVLEVGVGTGLAFPYYDRRIAITGIDASEAMLDIARKRVTEGRHNNVMALRQMDARSLDFPDESFDHIAAMHIMSVVPEPERVLAEMVRVCRVGGNVMIANHFAREKGGWTAVAQLLAPMANLLGWHSDFDQARVMGDARLRLEETANLPPFRMMTYLRFRRIA